MYVDTPEYSLAINPKTGLTSVLALIYTEYYDSRHSVYYDNASNYISLCKHYIVPFKPVVLMVRDPIERFLSAMTQVGLVDVNECLDSLINGSLVNYWGKPRKVCDDPHFRHQHGLIFGETHLFRSVDHYGDVAEFLGLHGSFPHLNKAQSPKPVLNDEQRGILGDFYAEDFRLFGSIIGPDIVVYS